MTYTKINVRQCRKYVYDGSEGEVKNMKKRNPLLVVLFSMLTLGIYTIVWVVKTNSALNGKYSDGWRPHPILPILVPFYSWYWLFKNSKRLGEDGVLVLILSIVLSPLIGCAILQHQINKNLSTLGA